MARKNRFSNKKVIVAKKVGLNDAKTFDGLPEFKIDKDGTFSQEITKSDGSKAQMVFHCNSSINPLKISNKLKKGKVYPAFFFPLYQHNKNIAIELARAFLSILQEKSLHSAITLIFSNLSTYIINKKINSLEELDLNDFNRIIEQVSHGRPQIAFRNTKQLFQILPSINAQVKLDVQEALYQKNKSEKQQKSFEERVAASKLQADYSDYVMFQIYAYANACLSEIEDTIKETKEYIENDSHESFFQKEGKEYYTSLIKSGDKESLQKAFLIELADSYKANNAIDLLKKNLTEIDWKKFENKINASNYQNLVSKNWNKRLLESSDVKFLCEEVIPKSLKNSKEYKTTFFKQIKTDGGLRSDFLYRSQYQSIRTSGLRNKLNNYQQYKHTQSFTFSSFYNYQNNGSHTGDPIHQILLGRTLHFDFILILLLLAETGRNKEVIMTIPNKINGLSILENDDLFASEKSAELFGIKKRGHAHLGSVQTESFTIPHQTPLYKSMTLFNFIRDQQIKDRSFLFTEKDVFKSWQVIFSEKTKIKNKNGSLIGSLDSTKFRKVFAGEMLQKWLKDIKNKDDLIKAVANDLQNTIPLTYLLQSSTTESMVSTAIVGLQMRFIEHHQMVAASLKLDGEQPDESRIQRFLCDCLDPTNPDYADNLNISYCKNYDNCLGCSRAEVYEEHLPNVIYRCFQYEELLKINRDLYDANYAIKHNRAKQVIDTFKLKTSNGMKIHSDAFNDAFEAWQDTDNFLLPPIIHLNA